MSERQKDRGDQRLKATVVREMTEVKGQNTPLYPSRALVQKNKSKVGSPDYYIFLLRQFSLLGMLSSWYLLKLNL